MAFVNAGAHASPVIYLSTQELLHIEWHFSLPFKGMKIDTSRLPLDVSYQIKDNVAGKAQGSADLLVPPATKALRIWIETQPRRDFSDPLEGVVMSETQIREVYAVVGKLLDLLY